MIATINIGCRFIHPGGEVERTVTNVCETSDWIEWASSGYPNRRFQGRLSAFARWAAKCHGVRA